MASFGEFSRTFSAEVGRAINEQARLATIAYAKQVNADILQEQSGRSGRRPGNHRVVNGIVQAPEEALTLPGYIRYLYDYRYEIAAEALDMLQAGSPRDSGAYARSHKLFVNGAEVASLPATLAETDDVVIANPLVYARRIEVGVRKDGTKFVSDVDRFLYRSVKRRLFRKWQSVAWVLNPYLEIPPASSYTIQGRLRLVERVYKANNMSSGHRAGLISRSYWSNARSAGEVVRVPALRLIPGPASALGYLA